MPPWLWTVVILTGSLFTLQLARVLSTVLLLPVTKGAMYVTTSRVRIETFLDAVPMKAGQMLVDLGCGDGRVLRHARRRYGTRGVGYELNPFAYVKAKIQCLGMRGVEIRRQNFWAANLSEADVVFCYLFPDVMGPLACKLRSDLRPGSTVVSCNFELPGFVPVKVLRPDSPLHNEPIYIYRADGNYLDVGTAGKTAAPQGKGNV